MWSNYRQLVKVDAIEGKVLVVGWVDCSSHHPGLDLVLLFGQQLELHVRVARLGRRILGGEVLAAVDGDDERVLVEAVPDGAVEGAEYLRAALGPGRPRDPEGRVVRRGRPPQRSPREGLQLVLVFKIAKTGIGVLQKNMDYF